MSELETLIAVAGTLGGTLGGLFLGYVLDERREANRLRRETALKPLEEKQSAFRDAYHKLIDLVFALNKLSPGQAGGTPLKETLDNFSAAIGLVIIWMRSSVDDLGKLLNAEVKIRETCLKSVRGETVATTEYADFSNTVAITTATIGKQLGVEGLDSQLREFAKSATKG